MSKDLLEVLPEMGVELQESSNGRWVAVCPFHEGDRDPSFTIYTHNDTYFCFGCQAWGDPVKFLCDYKGWTTKQAQEYVGVDYEYKKAEKARIIKTRDTVKTWTFLADVARLYAANLHNTPGALNYLKRRGLSDDTIRDYNIGYTDGRVINIKFAEEFRLAHECGLINEQGWEVMAHRITIPNYNSDTGRDSVDFIMGRTVTNDKLKYLGTRMPKPVYGFAQVMRSPILFVAEGQFDWLILRQWGFPAVILSGSHLPKYHHALLTHRTIIIVPDNDETGRKSAAKLQASLVNSLIMDYSALGVKDVGELGAREDGRESFIQILREQEWLNSIPLSKEIYQKFMPDLSDTRLSL